MRLAGIGGGILCFCVALLGASDASAQIYMETVGPAIQGDSTTTGYENHIVIDSGQWGVGTAPCVGTLSVSEFTVSKAADRATVDLLSAIQSGTVFDEIIVRYLTIDGVGGFIAYQTYRFRSATLTSYSSSSGGDQPSESLSVYFSEAEIEYVHIDSKGGQSAESMTLVTPGCAAF